MNEKCFLETFKENLKEMKENISLDCYESINTKNVIMDLEQWYCPFDAICDEIRKFCHDCYDPCPCKRCTPMTQKFKEAEEHFAEFKDSELTKKMVEIFKEVW